MNVRSHVQSHKLVHVSDVHGHVCASSTMGCAFVCFPSSGRYAMRCYAVTSIMAYALRPHGPQPARLLCP